MDAQVHEPLSSDRNAEQRTVHLLVAGNADFRSSAAAALDGTDIAIIDTTGTAEGVLEKIAASAIDCIVVDKTVGATNSFELCERIARKHRNPPAMVLLTEDGSPKTLLKAFRTGLGDCVVRDHDFGNELRQAVRRAAERAQKMHEVNDEIDYLGKLAKSDRLTGLPNRAFLEDRVANLAASSERHGGAFALFLIDVDNFRQINDIHGHAVGDQALKAFGRRLMVTSRASDSFGRFGGDEFLYLIDRAISKETVELVCDRLARALSFSMDLEAVGLKLTASIGAAIFPSDAATPDGLLAVASRAMASAKRRAQRYALAGEAAMSLADEAAAGGGNGGAPPPGNPYTVSLGEGRDAFADGGPRVIAPEAIVGHRGENRRVEHRNRVFKRGRIIFGDGYSTLDCVVRDLSLHGARITVEDQVSLPLHFSFSLTDGSAPQPAMRRWQRGKSIGLEFWIEQGGEKTPSGDTHRRG